MNAVRPLFSAGATGMVEDFRALADATTPTGEARYQEQPVLQDLARFLVRTGPNRDTAFYELCHLVNAVDAAGAARDRRNAFFLAPERASPGRFRARLDTALAKGGWRRPGFTREAEGVSARHDDGAFAVRFGRMPFLAALYEFLAGMDDFAFYEELQAIFDEMSAGGGLKAVQAASNRIASRFRQYRRRHLAPIRQDGKFDLLFSFLAARAPEGRLLVDDAAVLDFWAEKSAAGDFRSYRTVFDAFVQFLRALDEAARAEAVAGAAPIGADRESGEREPSEPAEIADDWVSPLAVLDQAPTAAIKFLKKDSERKPIEQLMTYGPAAARLPLAFLRLEAFGPVQSAITTDLQIGRGPDSVAARARCDNVESYDEIVTRLGEIREILGRLQKAAFYALHSSDQEMTSNAFCVSPAEADRHGPQAAEMETFMAEAVKAFRSFSRKGFDEAGLSDPGRREGFRLGAGALVAAAGQIETYLTAAGRLARGQALDQRFGADRQVFRRKFCALYGVKIHEQV